MSALQPVKNETRSMEERLAHVGAKIDQLVVDASRAKQALREKEEDARKRGEAAFDEVKVGLDKAWQELNQAWAEIRQGGERAVSKLGFDKSSCCHQQLEKKEDSSAG